jgi:hypothetical protein
MKSSLACHRSLGGDLSMAIYFDPLLANKIDPPVYV